MEKGINTRKITDILPNINKIRDMFYSRQLYRAVAEFLFFAILAQMLILLYVLFLLRADLNNAISSYDKKREQYIYWESVASQYPNAPDILYNASVAAYSFGQKERAIFYLDRAMEIDPLFENAKILRDKMVQKRS